jgi:hypothetical protein
MCVRLSRDAARTEMSKQAVAFAGIDIISVFALVLVIAIRGEPVKWGWSGEKAALDYSIQKYLPDYDVEIVNERDWYHPINIRAKGDHHIVFSFPSGHPWTVFTRWKDMLYIADFQHYAQGFEVLAADLNSGKELWHSRLQGLEPIEHSKYYNFINIETDGKRITVFGNEAHGRYIEQLDINTGKPLANTRLPVDKTLPIFPSTAPAN